ncbi:MAG: Flp pilus assembly protein CpaB [Methylobacteriaceae bacterium]|nr:Flp pilus assembly protein CpaB [Methylobacteriaceae bacterium]MBV9220738.1 Flp pilus assembly protein CpaB [Methylobacteriaceae bacterium]MBV9245812.1 Flp pilus assembly protein CpaB [Methylobacteriaceae bacterium]MBV9635412.1 Flp pilus assembly protein CpaB [Methylobacteriaceae bacterium]MBV9703420.1 Flp pilus assembly protein CpaB [Methylobacteriaceae bacterium]
MKPARIAVAGIAVAAGVGAMLMFGKTPQVPVPVIQAAPAIETDDVMVAARDLSMGDVITDADIAFQAWPRGSTSAAAIRKTDSPNIVEDIKGSVARANFLSGEPLRRDKLVKGPNAGFLSAILPSGARAVAINIDSRGSTSAGGFILPNDHVDIIHTYRDAEASKAAGADVYGSEVILTNVRVLAIGPNIQEKNGEKVVTGETATLELDSRQSQVITLAQRVGQLSLVLRSMLDANQGAEVAKNNDDDSDLTIIRYGIAAQAAKH